MPSRLSRGWHLAVCAILVYAIIRFEPKFAIGAVLAILHDALIMVAFIVWSRMQFNSTTIAAILTILGYSINDTVVIFDRIRENQKIFRTMPLKELINKSLNETLSRTIITSGTIFIVLIVLLIFGGEVTRGFAFALTIGIITGTYSSIYMASAVVLEWSDRTQKKAQLID